MQIPPLLLCDNISAISLSQNAIFHARKKHMEIDFHYIRDLVQERKVKIEYISTQDQTADIFTKALASARHNLLQSKLPV